MNVFSAIRVTVVLSGALICGGGAYAGTGPVSSPAVAVPTVTTTAAQNGALIVKLASAIPGATINYTVDGTTPTTLSQIYQAPFMVASNLTVKAIAVSGSSISSVISQSFAPNIPSNTLVWSEEFTNTSSANVEPDPNIWTYDMGHSGFGNHELENYCAWGSNSSPCSTSTPNAYVGTDGNLHIVARQPSPGMYTSARLTTKGLFSFQYGRFEVRARVPEAQGFWPAAWLVGNNDVTVGWPASGEQDVLERANAAKTPDWNLGSVHGIGFTGNIGLSTVFKFPQGQTAAGWHTYGMIWAKGVVAYYIDDPAHPYVTYTTANMTDLHGAIWPFDAGQSNFILLNVAIGGAMAGDPSNVSTPFPSEMLVDYVRVYTN
jgi:beta-glucanase (GH16 family)